MFFTQLPFLLFFLPAVALGYALLRRRAQWSLSWLLVASLVFYAIWRPAGVVILAASIIFNFLLAPRVRGNRGMLWLGLAGNLGLLALYKFWLTPMPLGISFFSFVEIAYLLEVYAGETQPAPVRSFSLMVAFFPKVIAGPIVRPSEFLPQIGKSGPPGDLRDGTTLFLIGFVKKLAADWIAQWATPVFAASALHPVGTGPAWIGVLAYTLEIYFDFSGYSDMAIGITRWFGFKLPVNFNSPYKAANMIDFWRRWHMTLTRFLTDNVFFNLPGNRKGPLRRHVNLLFTMTLCGLWHGTGWTFLVWGALHGVFLVINHSWRAAAQARKWPEMRVWLSRALTMLAVIAGWALFGAPTWTSVGNLLRGMAGMSGPGAEVANWLLALAGIIVLGAAASIGPNSQEIVARERERLTRVETRLRALSAWWLAPGLAVIWAVGVMLLLAEQPAGNPFIYAVF